MAILMLLIVSGCETLSSVPEGRIRVKNDSQDSDYNILTVYGGGVSLSLKPGEAKLLPAQSTSLTFRREYKDYVREYEVRCPENIGKGITIKLIDVHVNRIAGGCTTVSANKF